MPLVGGGNVIFRGAAGARAEATEALQSMLLRGLATTSPGKLRLTLIDCAGYGQSFSHLMKLPPLIRGEKAWHDPRDVERELAFLTDTLATIIQKYLTNEFADIGAYNRHAGEIAEPYRILAIANLPAGINEKLWARIVSLAENGPRAGIHVAATLATDETMPHRCDPSDLTRHFVTIEHSKTGWSCAWPPLAGQLRLDRVNEERTAAIVTYIQEAGKHADVVRVDFARLLPQVPMSSPLPTSEHDGIEIPLGRLGARQELCFSVQKGTGGHHALVGGQTGSGKSVLLHALILGLAYRFKPEDVELYLVDFKEGVEFLPYTRLPHTRVVATEAEREFALSVLRGLAREMVRRGELYQRHGVRNLKDWHARDLGALPYAFLVIDEFQVLFDRNDRTAGESRRLLDHLVREGRGFGIHVVLATQSLASVEIETSTLGQLGIRIALRMPESDSFRILAKDNDAAVHLTRAGEAVYNDGGGQRGRDHRFQVAFLDRAGCEQHVDHLADLARAAGWRRQPFVFDGRIAGRVDCNARLREAAASPPHQVPRALPLFLGEPMGMEDGHTHARLRRQGRSNILLIGPEEEDAIPTVAAACTSAALLSPRGGLDITVLDCSNVDSPLADALDLLRALPQQVDVWKINQRKAVGVIEDFAAEVEARLQHHATGQQRPRILAIVGLQRVRELQKDGYTAPALMKKFSAILRDGPDVGIHSFIAADSYSGLTRVLDPRDIEEFDTRVALRGGDSGRILGDHGSAAATLRPHYGVLYERDHAEFPQKFKCYSLSGVHAFVESVGLALASSGSSVSIPT